MRLPGDIQRSKADSDTGPKNHMRSLWVHPKVKFCIRGDIAAAVWKRTDRASHDRDFLYFLCEAWFLTDCRRYIREWADGNDRYLVGVRFDRANDEIHRTFLLGLFLGKPARRSWWRLVRP